MGSVEVDVLVEEAVDLADELIEAGHDEDKTTRAIAGFLDGIVPFDKLVPGPAGKLLEAHDDEAFEKIVAWFADKVKVDPVKRAARQARRKAKRAARKERKEAKRE